MKLNSKSNALLALVLAVSIAATGCSPQWINIALEDLPVLTQMALNIAALAATVNSGKQAGPGDAAVIQNISAHASRGLNLLQTLYADYKAQPSADTLQRIQNVVSDLNRNLPALLESAHISNAALTARIQAAVSLILTTVNDFAALIPQSSRTAQAIAPGTLPSAKQLKQRWNSRVCVPNPTEPAPSDCLIR